MTGNETVLQRAGVAAELPALLAGLGADVGAIFAGSGLDPAALTPETRVPLDTLGALIERAAGLTGRADLGLRLGQRFEMRHHGAIGALMDSAPTLGDALRDFVAFQPGYSSGAVVYMNTDGEVACFGSAICSPGVLPGRQYYACVLAIGRRMLSALTDGRVRVIEAHLSVRAPDSVLPYERCFGAPVRFDQPLSCMFLPAAALDMALPRHDPARHAALRAGLTDALRAAPPSAEARVRGALRKLLVLGRATMVDVAADLAIHPRTLRRRLADEGHSFEDLRDAVRFAVARELLEQTDLPIGEIAATLAYASPEVFAEAFRRIAGATPSTWRHRHPAPARP